MEWHRKACALQQAGEGACASLLSAACVPLFALLPSIACHAAADNAAAAAALSTGAINVDATTGRWEMRDEWLTAVNEVGGAQAQGRVKSMPEGVLK